MVLVERVQMYFASPLFPSLNRSFRHCFQVLGAEMTQIKLNITIRDAVKISPAMPLFIQTIQLKIMLEVSNETLIIAYTMGQIHCLLGRLTVLKPHLHVNDCNQMFKRRAWGDPFVPSHQRKHVGYDCVSKQYKPFVHGYVPCFREPEARVLMWLKIFGFN